ncbi:MAG: phosphomannomutase/phosphoglucomutase [Candidatus Binatia bacterium]
MKLNPQIFREYDIRGVPGVDYDEEFSARFGQALGTALLDRGISRAAVGRDCRLSSPAQAAALRAGLLSTGIDVIDVGMCATPLLYFAVHHLGLEAGVEVTGSHNPPDHNGFKIVIGKATIYGDDIRDLAVRIEKGEFRSGEGNASTYAIVPAYQGFMAEHFGHDAKGLKVVVDSGNGTGGPAARVYRNMGCEVTELYSEPDGTFPNHHPDPTLPENLADLIAKVKETGADLGIAFDGDSDRIGIVDGKGRVIWGDEMLVLFAREILSRHPGTAVVSEVKCSQRLYADIEAKGGRAIMWKAGHSLLKAKMRETGALLGGEMSGHIFFADRYFGFDDGIYAGARMIEILARSGRSLADLLGDLPRTVYTPEIRIPCPDEQKFRVAAAAQARFRELGHDLVDVDGVRVIFDHGWGLIRASNTQPILVLRFEATDDVSLARYRRLVEGELESLRRKVESDIAQEAGQPTGRETGEE